MWPPRGWKLVLWKEPRGTKVVSSKDFLLNIACLSSGNVEEHCGLIPQSLDNDATPIDPKLDEVVILSSDQGVVALNTNDDETILRRWGWISNWRRWQYSSI